MFRFCNLCAILVDFTDMALPPRDQRHQYLMYKGLQYSDADIVDFEARLARIYKREVHMVQVFDFGGLPDLMAEGLSARMLMKHRDAQGVSLFTSRAWRQLFDIRGLLVHELIMEFFSTFRFGETILDLDKAGALQFQLGGTVGFGAYWADSARQILDKGDLRDSWIGISSVGDFIGIALSYTSIRDLILRQCHRLIACNIAGRSQAPEKVTMTDLFYLRGMDVGSVNDRLWGLTVISPALPVIDMTELVRLQICMEIDDTWAWVAMGPERGDVHEIHGALAEQRKVIVAMARYFSRFTVWANSGIAQLLDSARVIYMPYSETRIQSQRRVRHRTDGASTSTAQQD
ncbi:hypothetical protein Tco_1371204 [Tanacetum coccineum]